MNTMARTSLAQKQATHDRIVEAASRAIRRSGYDGTGVADIMKDVGLTHGGFYRHFASREAMLAAAADRAGLESLVASQQVACSVPTEQALQSLLQAYLSDPHVNAIETGCPIAALGSEMPRQAPEVRRAATRRIQQMIELITQTIASATQDLTQDHTEEALFFLATAVGTLLLARAVDDPVLSESFRQTTLRHFSTPSA